MNVEQRISELKNIMETPENQLPFKTFNEMHARIEQLMGRAVYTHEFAFSQHLYDELRSGKKGYAFIESIKDIRDCMGKKILILVESEKE